MSNIENQNQHEIVYENDVILINENNHNFMDRCFIYSFIFILAIIFASLLFMILVMIYQYIIITFY